MSAYFAIFFSAILWTVATQFYAHLGKKLSVLRLNFYKSVVAIVGLFTVSLFLGPFFFPWDTTKYLLLSGIVGYALADLCIFASFSRMGASRTLMISSFGPAILALLSYFLLRETLNLRQVLGLAFMFLCCFFLAREKQEHSAFKVQTGLLAILGISLDCTGVILTKQAFLRSPELNPFIANFWRVSMALIFLTLLMKWKKAPWGLQDLKPKDRRALLISCFLGTFLAVVLYVYAFTHAKTAVIGALGNLSPIYAGVYEHWRERRFPSPPFIISMLCVGCGIFLLLTGI